MSLLYFFARAIDVLNFTTVNGKAIRIMYFHRDPSVRKWNCKYIHQGITTVNMSLRLTFNLDTLIDNKAYHITFSSFSNILSCKIATNGTGQSKGLQVCAF
ncbi:hypothetical protein Hanom_Chr12g01073251 [Helianthus anomalus]